MVRYLEREMLLFAELRLVRIATIFIAANSGFTADLFFRSSECEFYWLCRECARTERKHDSHKLIKDSLPPFCWLISLFIWYDLRT